MKSIIDFHKSDVPESLQTLLKNIFSSELKQISYSQSIISPIPFRIGVDMDKYFASRWLVGRLSKLGFSVSADEVKLYKESVAESLTDDFDL